MWQIPALAHRCKISSLTCVTQALFLALILLSKRFRIFKHDEGAYDGAPTFRFKLLKAEPFHLEEDGDAADVIEVFKVIFGGGCGDGTDAVEAVGGCGDLT